MWCVSKGLFAVLLLGAVFLSSLFVSHPAYATTQHYNGKITYVSLSVLIGYNQDVFSINPDGTYKTNLTHFPDFSYAPTWSPDGTKIVFYSSRNGGSDIYTMNPDGTNQTRLTSGISAGNPRYSPDGTKIVFTESVTPSNPEIFIMNADGSNQTRLTNSVGNDSWPSFSPDGTKILFQSNRSVSMDLYTMNADGSNVIRLTNSGNAAIYNFSGDYSPDGTKILFDSNRNGMFNVYTMNADGTNAQKLTTATYSNISYTPIPRWSPDGTKIVTSMLVSNTLSQIFTMNADGSNLVQIASSLGVDNFPTWQPLLQPAPSHPTPEIAAGSHVLSYSTLATYPDANAQPTPVGKILRNLSIFDGKLYISYGDATDNHGPVNVDPYNLATDTFDGVVATLRSESLVDFHKIDGRIYTTTYDPIGSEPGGYASGVSGGVWTVSTPLTARHVLNSQTFNGTDIWLMGAQGSPAMAWHSTDGGAHWAVALSDTSPFTTNNRFYWALVLNGKMYMQATAPGSAVKIYDGTSWTSGTTERVSLYSQIPVLFNNKIISVMNGLSMYDGTTVSKVNGFSGWGSDLYVDGDYLYVLRDDHTLVRTKDLTAWQELGQTPADTVSLAVYNDRIYLGAENATLYRSDIMTTALATPTTSGNTIVLPPLVFQTPAMQTNTNAVSVNADDNTAPPTRGANPHLSANTPVIPKTVVTDASSVGLTGNISSPVVIVGVVATLMAVFGAMVYLVIQYNHKH